MIVPSQAYSDVYVISLYLILPYEINFTVVMGKNITGGLMYKSTKLRSTSGSFVCLLFHFHRPIWLNHIRTIIFSLPLSQKCLRENALDNGCIHTFSPLYRLVTQII